MDISSDANCAFGHKLSVRMGLIDFLIFDNIGLTI